MVKTIQRKENIEMCVDNGVSKILKEGVVIDARFPLNMELAYEVLIREGYNKKKDFLYITTQYEHQYTELKYNKTATYIDEKTGEQCQGRYFSLQVPDRYVPSKRDVRADVIRTEEDIDKLCESMSKKESD